MMLPSIEMPMIGFGTFIGFEDDHIPDCKRVTEEVVFAALKAGYRHLDCGYGNENSIGKALQRAYQPVESGGLGLKREDIWITEKGSCRDNLESKLDKLGTTYVDLYLSHFPTDFASRESLVEAWSSINQLADAKKTRYIGVSNQYLPHLERLIKVCDQERLRLPYANEIEVNIWNGEAKYAAWCQERNIKVIAYSPLGYNCSSFCLQNEVIVQTAESILNATAAQVALAWNLARGIAVIPKSKTEARIIENFGAGKVQLTAEQVKAISDVAGDSPVTGTAEDYKTKADQINWE